jgi:hypothetical protein
MTDSDSRPATTGFLSDRDEISLAEARLEQTGSSVPDTLEVRSDSLALLRGSLEPLRQPAVAAVAALGIAVIAFVVGGLLSRGRNAGGASPVE